jgi:hypothetical protein
MITNFNTPSFNSGGSTGTGKKSNALYWLIGTALVGYVVYRYIIKPEIDKQKQYATITQKE